MAKSPVIRIFLIVLIAASLSAAAAATAIYLKRFTFDEERALAKWDKMILNGEVEYKQMKQGALGFVEAASDQACSAIYYRLGFKLKEYPVLSWRWRVLQFPDLAKATTPMEKDDYAARVYVIFPFLSFSSSKFIEYVWAEDIPVDTVLDSPAGSNVKMIVARSGYSSSAEGWETQKRNVYEDYVKAFGKEPKMPVGAVAIMCDADGTKSTAESQFDDIAIENE